LTSSGVSRGAPAQVSSGERTAEQPAPLSKPSDGRTAAVERVEGEDRCDPERRDRSDTGKCARVIENRAAQFPSRRPPTLSPEQRILADQYEQETLDSRSAARRLAIEGTGADDPDLQGIAAIVLRKPPPPEKPAKPEEDGATDAAAAIVNAIMGQGTASVPQPN
jgi:hypothetical protein